MIHPKYSTSASFSMKVHLLKITFFSFDLVLCPILDIQKTCSNFFLALPVSWYQIDGGGTRQSPPLLLGGPSRIFSYSRGITLNAPEWHLVPNEDLKYCSCCQALLQAFSHDLMH